MYSTISILQRIVVALIFSLFLALSLEINSYAQTLWSGPVTNFTQSDSNLVDVLVPGAVSLTRAYSQWLYNPAAGDGGPAPGTPTDTEWAFGTLDNYAGLYYRTFDSYRDGDLQTLLENNPMVVHLINENIYLSVTFTSWPKDGGFFAYTRSTPVVTITNPTNGATFAAPANVTIDATAADTNGPVTNVSFFANGSLIGSSKKSPYQVTDPNLGAGDYALTAVAMVGGESVTSSVVYMTVVTPAPIRLSSTRLAANQFSFAYSASPGLEYVIQSSSNLVHWLSFATNTATGNPMTFTNNVSASGSRFFRVVRVAN